MTYSIDFRKKVLDIKEKESLSFRKTAIRFGISVTTLLHWVKKIELKTTRKKSATKINMDALKQDIEQYPDAYQFERANRLSVSKSCIYYALKRLNITYKKNSYTSQSRRKTAQLISK